ncbi:hypothetical protein ACOSQ3_010840 [Xanthoceras sorbifolium]
MHDRPCLNDEIIVPWCRNFLSEFLSSLVQQRPADCVSRFERWIPPDEGFVKVNSNAAIDISRGMVGLGWVVRDSEGFVLLSAVKPVMGGFSLEVAEVLAVLTALQVARDSGFNRVILDMDASTIVKLIRSNMPNSAN